MTSPWLTMAVILGAVALLALQRRYYASRVLDLERRWREAAAQRSSKPDEDAGERGGRSEGTGVSAGGCRAGASGDGDDAQSTGLGQPAVLVDRDADEEVDRLRLDLEDSTRRLEEQKRAIEVYESRLRSASEEGEKNQFFIRYLDCILDSMTSGVMVFDILSRFTLLNREAEAILKRSSEELEGRFLIDCPNLSGLFALINEVRGSRPLVTRSNNQMEAQIEDFEGNSIPLGVSINGLVDSDGTVMGYVVICKDLSERKRMMANLERAEKLSALGTMASGVAHNFNNILAAILGRVQLLLRYPDKAKIIEGLKTIEKSALDGAATVKRIQDFARKRPLQEDFTPVDINEVVMDVIGFTKPRWGGRSGGPVIEVETDLNADRMVSGSASELREVFINLVINAVDAMPGGGTLGISSESDGVTVRVTVTDTGTGMSEDVRKRVFDPFFTTKGVKGTGLGLSESYGIIKRHKGTISCESAENEGTTFTIELPVTSRLSSQMEGGSTTRLDRVLSVLVVDDDEAQCELLGDILSAERHTVRMALSGNEAVEILSGDDEFDLVITDLAMPGLDGWTVASRAKELRPGLKTIVISGLGAEFPDDRIRECGVDLCLAKPMTLEMLNSALAKLFMSP